MRHLAPRRRRQRAVDNVQIPFSQRAESFEPKARRYAFVNLRPLLLVERLNGRSLFGQCLPQPETEYQFAGSQGAHNFCRAPLCRRRFHARLVVSNHFQILRNFIRRLSQHRLHRPPIQKLVIRILRAHCLASPANSFTPRVFLFPCSLVPCSLAPCFTHTAQPSSAKLASRARSPRPTHQTGAQSSARSKSGPDSGSPSGSDHPSLLPAQICSRGTDRVTTRPSGCADSASVNGSSN